MSGSPCPVECTRYVCRPELLMPTYEYQCTSCHERVEAVQKFTDPSLTTCPLCGGELRKVFSAVGIVFKGSGFYKNDSRGSSASSAKSESTTSSSDSTSSSDGAASSDGAGSSTPKTPAAPSTTTPNTASTASSASTSTD